MKTIIAIDPGMGSTGVVHIGVDKVVKIISTDTISTTSKDNISMRCYRIRKAIETIENNIWIHPAFRPPNERPAPQKILIEKTFVGGNPSSIMTLHKSVGAIMSGIHPAHSSLVEEVPILTYRSLFKIRHKSEVRSVLDKFNLPSYNEHIEDALLLGLWGIHTFIKDIKYVYPPID